jgi:hypothetical protein
MDNHRYRPYCLWAVAAVRAARVAVVQAALVAAAVRPVPVGAVRELLVAAVGLSPRVPIVGASPQPLCTSSLVSFFLL